LYPIDTSSDFLFGCEKVADTSDNTKEKIDPNFKVGIRIIFKMVRDGSLNEFGPKVGDDS